MNNIFISNLIAACFLILEPTFMRLDCQLSRFDNDGWSEMQFRDPRGMKNFCNFFLRGWIYMWTLYGWGYHIQYNHKANGMADLVNFLDRFFRELFFFHFLLSSLSADIIYIVNWPVLSFLGRCRSSAEVGATLPENRVFLRRRSLIRTWPWKTATFFAMPRPSWFPELIN